MPQQVAQPVFIFLPVADPGPGEDGVVVDSVCGRALRHETIAGRLLHKGRHHYFCSLQCAEQFASAARECESR